MTSINYISLTSNESSLIINDTNKEEISDIKCEICQREFKYNKVYKRHLKSHRNNKIENEFLCNKCNKRFVSIGFLERHIIIHNRNIKRKRVKKIKAVKSIIKESSEISEIDNYSIPYKRLFKHCNYLNNLCLICNQNFDDNTNHILSIHIKSFL